MESAEFALEMFSANKCSSKSVNPLFYFKNRKLSNIKYNFQCFSVFQFFTSSHNSLIGLLKNYLKKKKSKPYIFPKLSSVNFQIITFTSERQVNQC